MKQTEITEKEMKQAMEEMECWSVQNHLGKCKKCKALILKEVEKTCLEERKEEAKKKYDEIYAIVKSLLYEGRLTYSPNTPYKEKDAKEIEKSMSKIITCLMKWRTERLVLKKGKQI